MKPRENKAVWVDSAQRWRITVQRNGKRRQFYSAIPGASGRAECHKKADAWIAANAPIAGTGRVHEAYEGYLAMRLNLVNRGRLSRDEYTRDISFWKHRIEKVLGNKRIEALSQRDFQKVIDTAELDGKVDRNSLRESHTEYTGEPLSKKQLENLRGHLMLFLSYMRRSGITTLHIEPLIINRNAPVMEKTILTANDIKCLFSSPYTTYKNKVVEDIYIHLHRFVVLVGCRPGEAFGLRKEDFFENHFLFQRSINALGETTEGKNKNALRPFFIFPKLQQVLDDQSKLSKKMGVVSRSVFHDEKGNAVDGKVYRKALARYCAYNNLPQITPYRLRNTLISFAEGRVDLQLLKRAVGHSQSMDTFGVYGKDMLGVCERYSAEISSAFNAII